MKNKVVSGEYSKFGIISNGKCVQIVTGFMKTLDLTKENVETYEILNEEQRKSGTSAVLRGAVGTAIAGPVGMLAGLSAKNKGTYLIKITFKDGKVSVIEIDDKTYKKLITTCI